MKKNESSEVNREEILSTLTDELHLTKWQAERLMHRLDSPKERTLIMREAVENVAAINEAESKPWGDMRAARERKRMTEAEAGAFERPPVEIVNMMVDGKLTKVVLHDLNREKYQRQIAAKEKGVELVYSGDQEGAAKELGYENALEARKDIENKVQAASSGFEEAKGRMTSHIAQQENYKQIFRNQYYEMNTRIKLSLMASGIKLLISLLGLSGVLGIKPDDPIENLKKMPEEIEAIENKQVGKLVQDFNEKLLRMQKASFDKKVADTMYKMEDPTIANRFSSL